jgi:glycosyltransferase involved in cell wall biosynthesis
MTYIYVMAGRIKKDDAGALRVQMICKILKDLNKDVIVISQDEVEQNEVNSHNGIKYVSIRQNSNNLFYKVLNYINFRKRLKKQLNQLFQFEVIEGLFFYDIPPNAIIYLKNFARKNSLKIYHDSVEWYSSEQFKWGIFAYPFIFKNLLNRYLIDSQISVISISKFLLNHFHAKGISSIRIPIMLDMKEVSCTKNFNSEKLTIMYAGTPGTKDYLKTIIEGLSLLSIEMLRKVELHIFGISEDQLIQKCGISTNVFHVCKDSLFIHGIVKREIVLKQLEKSDFTVLLRASEFRYAKAGFPTKVVESLATATPVICNLSSDLGDYLIDGENSLIVENCTSSSFKKSIIRALALKYEDKKNMSESARKTALNMFDYRHFSKQFNLFLCEK